MPKILQDAGVNYGLTGIVSGVSANLPFEAGQAVVMLNLKNKLYP